MVAEFNEVLTQFEEKTAIHLGSLKWTAGIRLVNKGSILHHSRKKTAIDGFQMSIKHSTSGGQMHDQEAAVQLTFHLQRTSFSCLSVLMVVPLPVFCRQLHRTHAPTLAL